MCPRFAMAAALLPPGLAALLPPPLAALPVENGGPTVLHHGAPASVSVPAVSLDGSHAVGGAGEGEDEFEGLSFGQVRTRVCVQWRN